METAADLPAGSIRAYALIGKEVEDIFQAGSIGFIKFGVFTLSA
jgi:hypothetical protein